MRCHVKHTHFWTVQVYHQAQIYNGNMTFGMKISSSKSTLILLDFWLEFTFDNPSAHGRSKSTPPPVWTPHPTSYKEINSQHLNHKTREKRKEELVSYILVWQTSHRSCFLRNPRRPGSGGQGWCCWQSGII